MKNRILRYVLTGDFRTGGWTLWEQWELERQRNSWPPLVANEVVLLVSRKGEQLLFIPAENYLDGAQHVLNTHRLQLRGERWDPLKIREYAEKCGIILQGLKRYEKYCREEQERKKRRLR